MRSGQVVWGLWDNWQGRGENGLWSGCELMTTEMPVCSDVRQFGRFLRRSGKAVVPWELPCVMAFSGRCAFGDPGDSVTDFGFRDLENSGPADRADRVAGENKSAGQVALGSATLPNPVFFEECAGQVSLVL